MSSPIARLLVLVFAALAVVPATAGAATKSSIPKVTSVAPMKLKIGDRLTIKGSGFLKGKNRNTVVFKAPGQRAVFVKAESATATKLVVKVPVKLAAFLKTSAGASLATRFQLRVLARKLSPSYTPSKSSPVITAVDTPVTPTAPAKKSGSSSSSGAKTTPSTSTGTAVAASDCDADGVADADELDDDNDLLPDSLERIIGTNICLADSDGDGMADGWEYQSARDLNAESCPEASGEYPVACLAVKPYPGKRPYTNPLYADANADYDGDYLPAGWEYAAWKRHGQTTLADLWYSDGMQASQDTATGDGCRGLVEATIGGHVDKYPVGSTASPTAGIDTPRYAWLYGNDDYSLDTDGVGVPGHGCLSDDERDEDGDFLSNWDELNAMMSGPEYIQGVYKEPAFKTTYLGTDALDSDTDGDGIVDGLDDNDFDDFWNVEEVRRGSASSVEQKHADGADDDTEPDPSTANDTGERDGLWVDPYNPCLPAIYSRTCPRGLLLNGPAWRPFVKGDEDPPLNRWPLYHTALYSGGLGGAEIWDGALPAAQKLPLAPPGDPSPDLEHPLTPRP